MSAVTAFTIVRLHAGGHGSVRQREIERADQRGRRCGQRNECSQIDGGARPVTLHRIGLLAEQVPHHIRPPDRVIGRVDLELADPAASFPEQRTCGE